MTPARPGAEELGEAGQETHLERAGTQGDILLPGLSQGFRIDPHAL